MVKKGSKPVNNKAKSLFVKSESDNDLKGGNGKMGLMDFLKQFKPELEKAMEEVEKSETVTDTKSEAEVQFVTKAEFAEKMNTMENLMKDIKDSIVQKATADTALDKFVVEFATAYKKDTEDMKASFAKAMADFKREQVDKTNQAFANQLSPEDLLKKANHVDNIFNSNPGQLVSNMIEKGAADGRYKVDVPPSGKTSFQQVFVDMQTGGVN